MKRHSWKRTSKHVYTCVECGAKRKWFGRKRYYVSGSAGGFVARSYWRKVRPPCATDDAAPPRSRARRKGGRR